MYLFAVQFQSGRRLGRTASLSPLCKRQSRRYSNGNRSQQCYNSGEPSPSTPRASRKRTLPRTSPTQRVFSLTCIVCSAAVPNSRYKEKFQALREKYDRVTAKQQEYHQDLEIATAKIKKLQAENDLLLDAMNLAAAHQPSMFGLLPPSLPPTRHPAAAHGPRRVCRREHRRRATPRRSPARAPH
ncbi:hypothetical protein B0H13DRAFT_1004375 [Mycena leptocephala]|nr:hypothetical protein B0H13DRAFT_1004375 [Mycena leptocephala]